MKPLCTAGVLALLALGVAGASNEGVGVEAASRKEHTKPPRLFGAASTCEA